MSPPVADPPHPTNDGTDARTVAVHRSTRDPSVQTISHYRAPTRAELGSGILRIVRGPISGTKIALAHPYTTAGRHPDSAVLLDHITVSRRHAEFRWIDGHYWVIDTGSLNGVFVNQIQVESAPLVNGDEIWIGKFTLVFTCREPSKAGPREP